MVTPPQAAVAPSPPPERDPALLTAAMRCYRRQLELSDDARTYLASRGIDAEAARRLGLGYASGRGLREWLVQAGFDDRRILASGLAADGARALPRDDRRARTGRGTGPLARRSRRLASRCGRGFRRCPAPSPCSDARACLTSAPWVVVAEGLFDWLLLAAWGLPAVAALGTQGMDRLASSLQGTPRVLIAFDADQAGSDAARQLSALLGPHRARVVTLPAGVGDVAELGASRTGRSIFLDALQRAAVAAP